MIILETVLGKCKTMEVNLKFPLNIIHCDAINRLDAKTHGDKSSPKRNFQRRENNDAIAELYDGTNFAKLQFGQNALTSANF